MLLESLENLYLQYIFRGKYVFQINKDIRYRVTENGKPSEHSSLTMIFANMCLENCRIFCRLSTKMLEYI